MLCLVSVSRRIGDFADVIAQISQSKGSQLSVGLRHEVDAYLRCVDIQVVIFEEL
jgi:hypothetical protein